MRYGIVADIHNDIVRLRDVLEALRQEEATRFLTLGDTLDPLAPPLGADEVARTLMDLGTEGVWGNHDMFFSEPGETLNFEGFGKAAVQFMALMKPQLIVGDYLLTHRESSVDPVDVGQMWSGCDGTVQLAKIAEEAFSACPQRVQLVGHYHGWWAASSTGKIDWDGSTELHFTDGQRFFVVVGSVLNGDGAILDTDESCLIPVSV